MTSIHISDVRSYRSCRRKWGWSSPLKANLESTVPYVPFYVGKAIHHSLEMYYERGTDFSVSLDQYLRSEETNMLGVDALWPQEEKTFVEQVDLMRTILEHYKMWIEQDATKYSDTNLKFMSLETEFDIPFPVPKGQKPLSITLGGRFDGVVQIVSTGEYWLWETKTTRSIQELLRSLANDEQSTTYIYAASQVLKTPIKGVLYNLIRKKEPIIPGLLQNGFLSKKNIDTTSFVYLAEIRRRWPDWSISTIMENYGDILANLRENDSKYFARFPIYRTPYEINGVLDGLYYTALEMLNPDTPLYPAPAWNTCNFCSFRSPCLAMNAGNDYEFLLDSEYQVKQGQKSFREDPNNGF